MAPSSHSPIHLSPPSFCKSPPSPVMPFLPAFPQPHSSSSSLPTPLLQGLDEAAPPASQRFPHLSLLSLVALFSLLLLSPCLSVYVCVRGHAPTYTPTRWRERGALPFQPWCGATMDQRHLCANLKRAPFPHNTLSGGKLQSRDMVRTRHCFASSWEAVI